jgi:hypothetical protein
MKIILTLLVVTLHCVKGETFSERYMNGQVFYHTEEENSNLLLSENVAIQWFNQSLDHFIPSDTRTWLQVFPNNLLLSYII